MLLVMLQCAILIESARRSGTAACSGDSWAPRAGP
jgi:hypothetical protein